jgi:hypothetical protein
VALPHERFDEFSRMGIERPRAKGEMTTQVRGAVRCVLVGNTNLWAGDAGRLEGLIAAESGEHQ